MLKSEYGVKQYDPERLQELIVAAVAGPGRKSVAADLRKPYSTFCHELNGQSGYKLGLDTFVHILLLTKDHGVLDYLESLLGRVAYPVPHVEPPDPVDLIELAAKLTKEFSDVMAETAKALADGELTPSEAAQIRKEASELVNVAMEVTLYLERVATQE